jgi:feruloyl esterase
VHEALQFPGDYDGIVAGAPTNNSTHQEAGYIWDYQAFNRSPVNLTTAQATAITAALVKQCAGKDGGLNSDNFLTDPRDCHWDPAALQCTGGPTDASTCLSAPQVAAMRKFYEGPSNPRTGQRIYAGRVRGSESNNGYPAFIEAPATSQGASSYWVFGNDYDWLNFDFDHDMDTFDEALAAQNNANTADLEEFKSHGDKLMLMHGFADPRVPTLNTVAYYERLIASQARDGQHDRDQQEEALRRTQKFARLFLLPGVGHCGGGAGPDTIEGDTSTVSPGGPDIIAWLALDPLVRRVEYGVAPDRIIAYKVSSSGVTLFTPDLPLSGIAAVQRSRRSDKGQ